MARLQGIIHFQKVLSSGVTSKYYLWDVLYRWRDFKKITFLKAFPMMRLQILTFERMAFPMVCRKQKRKRKNRNPSTGNGEQEAQTRDTENAKRETRKQKTGNKQRPNGKPMGTPVPNMVILSEIK